MAHPARGPRSVAGPANEQIEGMEHNRTVCKGARGVGVASLRSATPTAASNRIVCVLVSPTECSRTSGIAAALQAQDRRALRAAALRFRTALGQLSESAARIGHGCPPNRRLANECASQAWSPKARRQRWPASTPGPVAPATAASSLRATRPQRRRRLRRRPQQTSEAAAARRLCMRRRGQTRRRARPP